jgi:hypothetical protein
MTEKLVVLAHEIGHVFDYTNSFPQVEELTMMFEFPDHHSLGCVYLDREKKAWGYAEYLLDYIGILPTVRTSFLEFKRKALAAYRSRLYRARRTGSHMPEKAAYVAALKKWKDMVKSEESKKSLNI